jgi:hypothetical protein
MSKSFFKKPNPYDKPKTLKVEAPKLSAKHRHHVEEDDELEEDSEEVEKAEEETPST